MLLNKLSNIKISYVNQLSEVDKKFCLDLEQKYLLVQSNLDKIAELAYDVSPFATVGHINNIKRENDQKLPCEVYGYFVSKYKITLAYNVKNPELELIIKDILNQLNGASFEQQTYQEMVNDFKSLLVDWHGRNYFEIKGNSLVYHSTFIKCGSYGNYYDNQRTTISKMRFLDYLDCSAYAKIHNYYQFNNWMPRDIEAFETLELDGDWLQSIKQFKNGKVQIKFVSSAKLQEFMKLLGLGE